MGRKLILSKRFVCADSKKVLQEYEVCESSVFPPLTERKSESDDSRVVSEEEEEQRDCSAATAELDADTEDLAGSQPQKLPEPCAGDEGSVQLVTAEVHSPPEQSDVSLAVTVTSATDSGQMANAEENTVPSNEQHTDATADHTNILYDTTTVADVNSKAKTGLPPGEEQGVCKENEPDVEKVIAADASAEEVSPCIDDPSQHTSVMLDDIGFADDEDTIESVI